MGEKKEKVREDFVSTRCALSAVFYLATHFLIKLILMPSTFPIRLRCPDRD